MKKDLNYIAALEKAMREKYGEETVINPKGNWTPEKEKEYLAESKASQIKEAKLEKSQERVEIDGVLIPKKLINKNIERYCQYCNVYSFNRDDGVYFTKYGTCYKCFVKYIMDREERWLNGWRPKNGV